MWSAVSSVAGSTALSRGFAATVAAPGADIDLLHPRARTRILDRSVDEHLSLVHHRDGVRDLEHAVDVVLHEQHRHVRGDALDDVADALALGGREPRERLVQQQNPRLRRKREAHVEEALPAIGERARLGPLDAGHAQIADDRRGLGFDLVDRSGIRPGIEALRVAGLHGKPEVLLDGQGRKEVRDLERAPDARLR